MTSYDDYRSRQSGVVLVVCILVPLAGDFFCGRGGALQKNEGYLYIDCSWEGYTKLGTLDGNEVHFTKPKSNIMIESFLLQL